MSSKRKEQIISGECEPSSLPSEGVSFRSFASQVVGAAGFSTAMTSFRNGAVMRAHVHDVSEAMTVLEGTALVRLNGREFVLAPYDCIHIPARTPHSVTNAPEVSMLRIHSAFGSAQPRCDFVESHPEQNQPSCDDHAVETVLRFETCPIYELSPGAFFRDLFARRLGSVGICGGFGLFNPGASLPCHTHQYDESISIVSGKANCLVRGNRYVLSGYDTAFVPEGEPHRFLNESDETMAMIWVYAGDEPDRQLVDNGYCSGALIWPETSAG
jgi:quercetin dioxygenase-like cupin family protein